MKTPPPSTAYLISGVWTDYKSEISHYAVHQLLNPGVSGCKKFTREETIDLVENGGKPFYVFGWDYTKGRFRQGQRIIVVNGYKEKYLTVESREERTKNLKHLIRISWFEEVKTMS